MAAFFALWVGPARASVIWSGDAETGDLSQWSGAAYTCSVHGKVYTDPGTCADRIQVVSSPTSGSHSRYAYRFEVRDGDLSPWGGERNEIKQKGSDKVYPRGSERWFGYSVLLPGSFPYDDQGVVNDWTAFSGWKTLETHGGGPSAINMQTGGDQLSLKHASKPWYYLWRTPLVRDRWQRFVVHIKFDPDPRVGFVEMWKDGELVLPKTHASTMETYNGHVDPTYSKIGYYRHSDISGTSQIYIDDYRVGTTRAAVTPPAPGSRSAPVAAAEPSVLQPAKLEVARSGVLRDREALDVLAPITRRASGEVDVDFHAAGRHTRFSAPIDEAQGRVRFRRAIPREQARRQTGILTLTYAGNQRTRGQQVRLRAAAGRARLEAERPSLRGGRLRARGSISRRARGVVRVQLSWATGGRDHSVELQAPVRDGRWELDQPLSDTVARLIADRDGTLHSYTLFTGYLPARMRGEMQAYQVLGAP